MDEEAKKHLLRSIPYGLYAACTRSPDGDHHAFLLSWVTQASFDPPLIVCCVHRESTAYEHLSRAPALAINLLGDDQKELATRILGKGSVEGDRVAGEATKTAANGCLMLPSTLGAIEARVVDEAGEGDHAVLVCRVTDAHRFRDGEPLTHQTSGMTYAG